MSLTFSLRNNPGRYALLIGSGVSTGAGIPTGWAVVEDLIKKLATARGVEPSPDLFSWYEEEYGKEPAYDDLIGEIADSKEERRALLEDYFEPTEEERENDEKTPTEAHESIAWLVDNGYVNVIITTNFDRLLEKALENRGVTPVVISGPESAMGAEPLAHQDTVILKINGDYKETNIKNLASELKEYEKPVQSRIDRVFNEYGLVVCGWSGQWDTRLRESLLSCEKHRYSTYWAHRGDLEDSAKELVAHRDGNAIQIEGASHFFSELKESIRALEDTESGAPLTREIARERVKRYLPREEHRIDLADLLKSEAEDLRDLVHDEDKYPLAGEDFDLGDRLNEFEEASGTLAVAVMTCGYWGVKSANSAVEPVWQAVRRSGSTMLPEGRFTDQARLLRRYPALIAMYGAGTTALASGHWDLIRELLGDSTIRVQIRARTKDRQSVFALHPWRMSDEIDSEMLRKRTKDMLRDLAVDLIPDEEEFDTAFHRFAALADMRLIEIMEEKRGSLRRLSTGYWGETISTLEEELESKGEDWGPLRVGLFDASPERAKELLEALEESQW
ncbi:SIR2 family protein [Halorubrum ezzemoulense]|uniref:SIR2 family protein n=1 Tax=Halorubrum ezzemoulense TaxID=337243 RepID=UPI00232F7A76|nr:SIR2 family protein [Halorubrum ezzemoulense]MDB9247914.1 SIR2 family protein [Halorubrum ezzemoulense]MDB9258177.1 SIR2 family protein [Halorubrum ezzemoulense]MDB9261461.1 SIR2 family protein [Halorubrum ezzemoulense]MDB9264964.1 SIR2 family protein [Halorubrum ezzemoulense]MDB9268538.1 SIR2 family protein [Halorubrum ezzemoulense]